MSPPRIAVIGAGVIGTVLAHRLTRHGAKVTLLERSEPGNGTSRWSFAWLNSNNKTPRAFHDLNTASMAAWARLAASEDGTRWYRPVGNLRWADGDSARSALTERIERLQTWGYAAESVDRHRVADLEPALALPEDVEEAAWFPTEGYVRTGPLIEALLHRARSLGAQIRTGRAGYVVDLERRGAAHAVRTADGGRVEADVVVCCTGRWTPQVARLVGVDVPVVDPEVAGSTAPGLVVRVCGVTESPRRVLHTPGVHVRPHDADQVHLEATDTATVELHTPDAQLDTWAATLLTRAQQILPGLRGAHVAHRTVCVRPMPVDGLPVVGPVDGEGAYVVLTHSGVTLAAGLAELVTRELLDDTPVPQLAPFRPGRPSTRNRPSP